VKWWLANKQPVLFAAGKNSPDSNSIAACFVHLTAIDAHQGYGLWGYR
jgi:hypothetical protein